MLYLTFVVILFVSSTASAQQEGTCRVCNCQFNNVDVLTELIESKVATTRANESGKIARSKLIYMQTNSSAS